MLFPVGLYVLLPMPMLTLGLPAAIHSSRTESAQLPVTRRLITSTSHGSEVTNTLSSQNVPSPAMMSRERKATLAPIGTDERSTTAL